MLPVFQWFEDSGLGRAVRESVWAFAAIESVHLLALAAMGGAVLLVDFRTLNLGLRHRSVSELAREVQPLVTLSLIVLVLTGVALFASEGVKCYYSTPFWVKMWTLLAATIYTYTIRKRSVMSSTPGGSQAIIAIGSMALWFVVAAAGRWIGFSG
jgi:hypothetical protein